MNKTTNIVFVPGDNFACGYYRLIQVFRLMYLGCRKDYSVTMLPMGKFTYMGPNSIIYTQRICNEKSLKPLYEFKKKFGLKIVCDFDDLLWEYEGQSIPEYNYCRAFQDMHGNTEYMKEYADKVLDHVTVSTEYLKKSLLQFMPEDKITVMPNRLTYSEWGFDKVDRIPAEDIFLWAGSKTHYDDVNKKYGDFTSAWAKYLSGKKIITMSNTPWFIKPTLQLPGAGLNTYPSSFRKAALQSKFVMAPLVNNSFNASKSHLKYLECCAVGRVCLCSTFENGPYEGAHEYQKVPLDTTYKGLEYIVERAKEHYVEILRHQYGYMQKYWLDNSIGEYWNLFDRLTGKNEPGK